MNVSSPTTADAETVAVRRVRAGDIADVIALDERVTGLAKPDYWRDVFDRYGERRLNERFFLVAEPVAANGRSIVGFIIGEVRAWEFGSPPSGWIFAIHISPSARLQGLGTLLFDEICVRFRKAGVTHVRTMLAKDANVLLSFFRSQGMMGGPFIQLEKRLQ